jgi:capsular polysaccharide biosynthesis protein
MNQQPVASDKLDMVRLTQLLVKWRKQLIYTGIGAVIVSIIFTMPQIMTPMFKAEMIIYPVNLQTYSKETPTEQMVQLLNSEDVKDNLIKDFHLYSHYDIDSTGSYPRFEILKRLAENISINKTEFESIEITVIDKDPKIAARLCDSIASYVDQKAISLLRTRSQEIVTITKMQMDEKKLELDSLENAIKSIRANYGITDFENQIEGFSREYYRTMAKRKCANSRMETQRKNLEEKGGEYVLLKELLWRVRGTLCRLQTEIRTGAYRHKKGVGFPHHRNQGDTT